MANATPFCSQAAIMRSHRWSVISKGFSTITCFPARAAARHGSKWAPLGVQIDTTSTSGSRNSAAKLA